jgi:hypothetical protein
MIQEAIGVQDVIIYSALDDSAPEPKVRAQILPGKSSITYFAE